MAAYSRREPSLVEEVVSVRKGRRDRRPTACRDKRRDIFACGCCGSENIAKQGVSTCETCGAEAEFLVGEGEARNDFLQKNNTPGCGCLVKKYRFNPYQRVYVTKCLDCGAVEGPRCPACGKSAWKQKKVCYCKKCGFRKG